jgi:hypothetical protein
LAENNLIAAQATYAQARAALYQMVASTLQHYGINLSEAATGNVTTAPLVSGVSTVKDAKAEPATVAPPAQ